jgi:hypothetical protein
MHRFHLFVLTPLMIYLENKYLFLNQTTKKETSRTVGGKYYYDYYLS